MTSRAGGQNVANYEEANKTPLPEKYLECLRYRHGQPGERKLKAMATRELWGQFVAGSMGAMEREVLVQVTPQVAEHVRRGEDAGTAVCTVTIDEREGGLSLELWVDQGKATGLEFWWEGKRTDNARLDLESPTGKPYG